MQLWNENSILPYEEHIRAQVTFDVPACTDIKDYMVVYKGAINDFQYPDDTDPDDTQALACWTKSASSTAPATSYTFLVTEWGGTDGYSDCAHYTFDIFDMENPDGYTLNKTPDSSCLDCRWYEMDHHVCEWFQPCSNCDMTQIMILRSSSPDVFCVIITPFWETRCGQVVGCLCPGSYKRCFYRQPEESYADFWDRIFNGGVFGDGSETDCTEDGCIIPALGGWTDSWVRVMWLPTTEMMGAGGGMDGMAAGELILMGETAPVEAAAQSQVEPSASEQIEQIKYFLDWLYEIRDQVDEDTWLNLTASLEEMLEDLQQE